MADPRVRLSEDIEADGLAFFEAAKARGLEGIMAKDRRSPYLPGVRSKAWQKVKIRPEQELVVGGLDARDRRRRRPRRAPQSGCTRTARSGMPARSV